MKASTKTRCLEENVLGEMSLNWNNLWKFLESTFILTKSNLIHWCCFLIVLSCFEAVCFLLFSLEKLFYRTASIKPGNVNTKISPGTCIDLDISKVGEVNKKKELKTMLKWGKFFFHLILDWEIFRYLKNKKYLILIVNSRKFNGFLSFIDTPCY